MAYAPTYDDRLNDGFRMLKSSEDEDIGDQLGDEHIAYIDHCFGPTEITIAYKEYWHEKQRYYKSIYGG